MVEKPDKLPVWASEDTYNDTTCQYNVVEPPQDKKRSGWDYLEFPVRNWMNWLQRKTYEWLDFLSKEQARRIIIRGAAIKPVLGNQLLMLYVTCESDSGIFYVGIGYADEDRNVISMNTIASDGYTTVDIMYGELQVIADGYAYDDIIIVLEQLGVPNE
jgi:hypothetical protein